MSELQRLFVLDKTPERLFVGNLGESAICSKCEQNSTAAFLVAYLFFIIYWKTTVGQFTNLKFIQHYFFSSQCFLHIDDSLILTSLPMKFSIKFFLYKKVHLRSHRNISQHPVSWSHPSRILYTARLSYLEMFLWSLLPELQLLHGLLGEVDLLRWMWHLRYSLVWSLQ